MYGCRLQPKRVEVPQTSNMSHTKEWHAQSNVRGLWPGLDNDIDNVVSQCKQCQTHLPSHPKEPLVNKPRPTRPFQEIAADFCHHAGQCYLVIVDCFTDWPTVIPLGTSTTSRDLISATMELFSRTAVPNVSGQMRGLSSLPKSSSNFLTNGAPNIVPPLPTKQWESRIHCKGNENNNSDSMEWQVFK